MKKEWTRKPNNETKAITTNADELEEQMQQIVQTYLEDHQDKKVVVLLDKTDEIYLLVFANDEKELLEKTDVLLFNPSTDAYEFLPEKLAVPIANAYIEHISAVAEGYLYLNKEKGE